MLIWSTVLMEAIPLVYCIYVPLPRNVDLIVLFCFWTIYSPVRESSHTASTRVCFQFGTFSMHSMARWCRVSADEMKPWTLPRCKHGLYHVCSWSCPLFFFFASGTLLTGAKRCAGACELVFRTEAPLAKSFNVHSSWVSDVARMHFSRNATYGVTVTCCMVFFAVKLCRVLLLFFFVNIRVLCAGCPQARGRVFWAGRGRERRDPFGGRVPQSPSRDRQGQGRWITLSSRTGIAMASHYL